MRYYLQANAKSNNKGKYGWVSFSDRKAVDLKSARIFLIKDKPYWNNKIDMDLRIVDVNHSIRH